MSETLLGVIIGGSIAGLCGVITAFAQYCFDKSKRKQEKLDEIEKNNRIKKELYYAQFIQLRSILFGFQYGLNTAEGKEMYIDSFRSIHGEELKKHYSKAYDNIANFSLFCNSNITSRCNMFSFKYFRIDDTNMKEASLELEEIITLMRKDLGVE